MKADERAGRALAWLGAWLVNANGRGEREGGYWLSLDAALSDAGERRFFAHVTYRPPSELDATEIYASGEGSTPGAALAALVEAMIGLDAAGQGRAPLPDVWSVWRVLAPARD